MASVRLLMGTLVMILGTVVSDAQNINFSFPHFDAADHFLMVSDVKHDAANASFVLNPSGQNVNSGCGWLMYRDKLQMRDAPSGAVASFHTSFTFQITAPNVTRGDGLSFFFSRNNTILDETAGEFLCLLNGLRDGKASNKLFAIEFDSSWNPSSSDPSDSHIGVDVNSVSSSWSYNLCGASVTNCSYLSNGGYFTAWIDFDGASHALEVFFGNGSSAVKPQNPLITASIPSFADLVDEYMYVGFAGSRSSGSSEIHEIQSWTFISAGFGGAVVAEGAGGRKSVVMVAGIVAAVVSVLALVVAYVCYRKWSSFRTRDKRISLVGQSLTPRMFTSKELSKATRRFSQSELLGRGGFGAVYRGCVNGGELVAVKRMRMESANGEESFKAEIASLSQIRHRNLVQLRGWCHEGDELMLVYDYMPHGSLDEWLHQFAKQNAGGLLTLIGRRSLPLTLRHSVLRGVAAGLLYLHEECAQCVLHRDIKSSNVLLDGEWNAYLGDFGLARVVDHQKLEKTTMMAGTLGYMAPEIAHTGKATKETDVYSFGVLVLEVICGMRPLGACGITQGDGILVDSVWRAHEAGNILRVADSSLGPDVKKTKFGSHETLEGGAAEDKKTMQNLLRLGLLCCNPNAEDRPSMHLVNQLLQSSRDMKKYTPPLPECKPQSQYSRRRYPNVDPSTIMPSSPWSATSSNSPNVRNFALGTSLSSSGVSSGEHGNNPESFCAPDMSVLVPR